MALIFRHLLKRGSSRAPDTESYGNVLPGVHHNSHSTVRQDAIRPSEKFLVSENGSSGQDSEITLPSPPDDPFGDEREAAVQYKTMEWWHVSLLMLAETISLGVLSLPFAVAYVGLVPGILLIIGLGLIATYNGYVIGQFKLAHPRVTSMAVAGEILFGWIGREVFAIAQLIVLIFIMAAHLTSFTIMMNVLTQHSMCSIVFSVVGLAISFILSLPRTMHRMSYISILSSISVVTAVIMVMADVGNHHQGGAKTLEYFKKTELHLAMTATLNIIVSYTGHVAYFSFASELRNPGDFKKALFLQQAISITFYTLVGALVYYYVGPNVPSPALGAATPKMAKAAYGVASLTIIVAGVVNGHVACKDVYIRYFRNIMHERSLRSLSAWWTINAVAWLVSWILSQSIPSFPHMLAMVSALFSGWFSYGVSGMFWLQMNGGIKTWTPSTAAPKIFNILIVCMGAVICGVGLYATGTSLRGGLGGKPFSCDDNANVLPERQ